MHIVSTAKFRAFAEAVLRLGSAGWVEETDPDQVKIALAEYLDVWPAALFDDVAGDETGEPFANRISGPVPST